MVDIKKQFENTAELYRIELCKMWEIAYGDTDWIADGVGGVLDIQSGVLTLSFDDVRYIVDHKIGMDVVEEWQEYNTGVCFVKDGLHNINLDHWVKGCPHVDASAWWNALYLIGEK